MTLGGAASFTWAGFGEGAGGGSMTRGLWCDCAASGVWATIGDSGCLSGGGLGRLVRESIHSCADVEVLDIHFDAAARTSGRSDRQRQRSATEQQNNDRDRQPPGFSSDALARGRKAELKRLRQFLRRQQRIVRARSRCRTGRGGAPDLQWAWRRESQQAGGTSTPAPSPPRPPPACHRPTSTAWRIRCPNAPAHVLPDQAALAPRGSRRRFWRRRRGTLRHGRRRRTRLAALEQDIGVQRRLLKAIAVGAEIRLFADFSATRITHAKFATESLDLAGALPQLVRRGPTNDGIACHLPAFHQGQKRVKAHARRPGIANLANVPRADARLGRATCRRRIGQCAARARRGGVKLVGDFARQAAEGTDMPIRGRVSGRGGGRRGRIRGSGHGALFGGVCKLRLHTARRVMPHPWVTATTPATHT